jgi:hypothetical protein
LTDETNALSIVDDSQIFVVKFDWRGHNCDCDFVTKT